MDLPCGRAFQKHLNWLNEAQIDRCCFRVCVCTEWSNSSSNSLSCNLKLAWNQISSRKVIMMNDHHGSRLWPLWLWWTGCTLLVRTAIAVALRTHIPRTEFQCDVDFDQLLMCRFWSQSHLNLYWRDYIGRIFYLHLKGCRTSYWSSLSLVQQ